MIAIRVQEYAQAVEKIFATEYVANLIPFLRIPNGHAIAVEVASCTMNVERNDEFPVARLDRLEETGITKENFRGFTRRWYASRSGVG